MFLDTCCERRERIRNAPRKVLAASRFGLAWPYPAVTLITRGEVPLSVVEFDFKSALPRTAASLPLAGQQGCLLAGMARHSSDSSSRLTPICERGAVDSSRGHRHRGSSVQRTAAAGSANRVTDRG